MKHTVFVPKLGLFLNCLTWVVYCALAGVITDGYSCTRARGVRCAREGEGARSWASRSTSYHATTYNLSHIQNAGPGLYEQAECNYWLAGTNSRRSVGYKCGSLGHDNRSHTLFRLQEM